MEKKDYALLLTQYERYGKVGMDEVVEMFIDEELNVDEDLIGAYNEYLIENKDEPYEDDLDMMLEGKTPTEIARCVTYGDFHFSYPYHRYNGYENIDSFETYDVVREIKEDKAFLKKYIEDENLIDKDKAKEIIDFANSLIRQGY